MRKTLSKMHMPDMVTIDTIVLEIAGGWFLPPPLTPLIVNFLKHPRSDRVTACYIMTLTAQLSHQLHNSTMGNLWLLHGLKLISG